MENRSTPLPRGTEAIVRLTTKLPNHLQVPDDDLVVPSSLARYGLSEVVNKLLGLEQPKPFDFLIDGEFLRTSVAQFLEARKLSSEKVLQLEYVLALSEPEQTQVDQTPDWIASVAALGMVPTAFFASAGYDGVLRVFEGTKSCFTAKLSDRPLTALATLPTERGSLLLVASKDGAARCCSVRHGGKDGVQMGRVATLRAPGALGVTATQAVAISEDGTLLASAGWDNEVLVWNADPALFADPDVSDAKATPGSKRKSAGVDVGDGKAPKFTLDGHSQVVSSLHFGSRARFPFTLLSASWDSSLRVWDTAAASCVCNWTVARAVTSFSTSPESSASPQFATSHEDGHISIWDVRAPPHATIQGAVSLDVTAGLPLSSAQVPHRRMASQVAWCPLDVTRLASVGHDGFLNILDPRSPKMPLQSLKLGAKGGVNPTKLLCCNWLSRDELALGGSDGKVVRVAIGVPGRPEA